MGILKKTEYVEMSDNAFLYTEYWKGEKKGPSTDTQPSGKSTDAVIFIPGFCCTSAFFENNAPVIAGDYDVIVYDPRGQGNSTKGLQGHTVARNALDLREIILHFDVKKAAVVAWSMAGQFVMDYVRQFGTDRIGSIILADCPLHAAGSEEWNAHGLRGYNMDHFNAHLEKSYNEWADYCRGFAVKIWSGIDDSKIDWAAEEFKKTPPWIAFAVYSDMVFRNGFPYLARADVPMLFTGADSRVTENGIDLASKWYPGSRSADLISKVCTFDHGGHVFFYTESEKFNRALLDFLEEIPRK